MALDGRLTAAHCHRLPPNGRYMTDTYGLDVFDGEQDYIKHKGRAKRTHAQIMWQRAYAKIIKHRVMEGQILDGCRWVHSTPYIGPMHSRTRDSFNRCCYGPRCMYWWAARRRPRRRPRRPWNCPTAMPTTAPESPRPWTLRIPLMHRSRASHPGRCSTTMCTVITLFVLFWLFSNLP